MDTQGSAGVVAVDFMKFDPDQFENTAAWLQYCDGLGRFAAETEAARRQGVLRVEAMRHAENYKRDIAKAWYHGEAAKRDNAHDLPTMQSDTKEKDRPLPKRYVQA